MLHWPDGPPGAGRVAGDQLHWDVGPPGALPGLVGGSYPALGMEGAALHQRLGVTDTPAVEILSKVMSVPVDKSRYKYI